MRYALVSLADKSMHSHAATRVPVLSTDTYLGRALDLSAVDLEEIANALSDETDYEHHWLINPDTGELAFWTSDTGIDGQTPVDLDELDLVVIHPLPSAHGTRQQTGCGSRDSLDQLVFPRSIVIRVKPSHQLRESIFARWRSGSTSQCKPASSVKRTIIRAFP
jgi:hypothetical protein